MRNAVYLLSALYALIALASCSASVEDPRLREELIARMNRDQSLLRGLIDGRFGEGPQAEAASRELQQTLRENAEWVEGLIKSNGWPGHARVGVDGSHAAWLLVQHSSADTRKAALPLLEHAVETGDAPAIDLARLVDRVRLEQGLPQQYGTHLKITESGCHVVAEIDDREAVETRRNAVGLPPLIEGARQVAEKYHGELCEDAGI